MARIFDNIDNDLLTTLRATMQVSHRSDFCVGCLNPRGCQASYVWRDVERGLIP
jgi:hypothetical protein